MGILGKSKETKKTSKSDAGHITTLIGAGCEFEGNMTTTTSTRIDGKLNGKIAGNNTIIVGEDGIVVGEIKAADTVVYGRVEGVIESHSLEIKRSGNVLGDVFIESLIVEDGGVFNGRCTMDEVTEQISIETTQGSKEELSSNTLEFKSSPFND